MPRARVENRVESVIRTLYCFNKLLFQTSLSLSLSLSLFPCDCKPRDFSLVFFSLFFRTIRVGKVLKQKKKKK